MMNTLKRPQTVNREKKSGCYIIVVIFTRFGAENVPKSLIKLRERERENSEGKLEKCQNGMT